MVSEMGNLTYGVSSADSSFSCSEGGSATDVECLSSGTVTRSSINYHPFPSQLQEGGETRSDDRHAKSLGLRQSTGHLESSGGPNSAKSQWLLHVPPALTLKPFLFCPQSAFTYFVSFSE
jgi:hypothetical protein